MTAYQFPEERARRIAEYERLVSQLTVDVDRLWKRAIETSTGPQQQNTRPFYGGPIGIHHTTLQRWNYIKPWFPDAVFIDDILDNIERINECTFILVGQYKACGTAIRQIGVANLPIVADWVLDGGRLFIGSEHNGLYSAGERPVGGCASDIQTLNDWLLSLGCSLRNEGFSHIGTSPGVTNPTERGNAAVASYGVPGNSGAHGIITGGHSIRITTNVYRPINPELPQPPPESGPPYCLCAIEQVGDGFIILGSDSDWFASIPPSLDGEPETELFRAMWNLPPELLI